MKGAVHAAPFRMSAPEVALRMPAPEVALRMPAPEVALRMPAPEVALRIPHRKTRGGQFPWAFLVFGSAPSTSFRLPSGVRSFTVVDFLMAIAAHIVFSAAGSAPS